MVGTYTIMTPIMANDSLTVSGNVRVRGDIEIGGDKISVLKMIASFNSLGLISSTATATVTTTLENLVSVSGKVGVGLASPNYTLDVGGDINCSGQFLINGVPLITEKSSEVSNETIRNEGIVIIKKDEKYYVEDREIELKTTDKNMEYMYVKDAISLSGNMIMDGMIAVSGLGLLMEEGGKGIVQVDEGNEFMVRLNKEDILKITKEGLDIKGTIKVNGIELSKNVVTQITTSSNSSIVLSNNNIPINTLSLPSPNNLYYFVLNMKKGQKVKIHINLVVFSVVTITTGWTITRSVGSNVPLVNAYNIANGLEINKRDIGALVNASNISTVLGGGYCGANSAHSIVIDMIDEPDYEGNVCYALRGVGSNAGTMSYHLSYYVEMI